MAKFLMSVLVFLTISVLVSGCHNRSELAESSFGHINENTSKASAASVISMGRDDDDGHAKKWHIGDGGGKIVNQSKR